MTTTHTNTEALVAMATDRAAPFDVLKAADVYPAATNDNGFRFVWQSLAGTADDAAAYLASLDADDAREEAALAFDAAGWTPATINARRA